MSIRKIQINVKNTTEPISLERVWAGIQYEDNATEIIFDLSSVDITNALYRIDLNSAGAGYHPSENLSISGGKIKRSIPKAITFYGGEAEAVAVITELGSGGAQTGVVYSYPVTLYFTPVEKSEFGNETVEGNVSQMEESVKEMTEATQKNTEIAMNAAESALLSKKSTEEARFALENGSEFVFVGGSADSTSSIEFTSKDFIVEQGTSGVWTYRKWSSGIAECWTADCSINCTFTNTWGSLFRSDETFPQIDYPFKFVEAPICNFDLGSTASAAGYFFSRNSRDAGLSEHIPKIYAWSGIQYDEAQQITAHISVIGRWK